MSLAAPAEPRATRGARRLGVPETALIVALVALVLAAAWVGVHVRYALLDETLYETSARHYGHDLPHSFFSDVTARATSRLYALGLAPLFSLFDADVAVRLAKLANAIAFVSTALPTYLMAQRVVRSPWSAVLAAVGAVALPWLVFSTALLTEDLAYPLVAWVAWAMLRAVRRPSWRADVLVLALIAVALGARVQLVALWGGYLVVALVWAGRGRPRAVLGRLWKGFPALTISAAAAGVAVLALLFVPSLRHHVDHLLGTYAFDHRRVVPADVGLGLGIQFVGIGLGIGLVPLVLAGAWLPGALSAREHWPSSFWLAVVGLALTVAVVGFAMVAQNGYVGALTEERYYVYTVPLLWVAAMAALDGAPAVPRGRVAAVGAVVVVLLGTIDLPQAIGPDRALFAPAGVMGERASVVVVDDVRRLTGLSGGSTRDARGLLGVVAIGGLWLAWEHPRARRAFALGVAGVLEGGLLLFVLTASLGSTAGGLVARDTGPSFRSLGWIDRAPGSGSVQWLQSELRPGDGLATQAAQLRTLFFNSRVGSRVVAAGTFPVADWLHVGVLPFTSGSVAADGHLALPDEPTVQSIDSPVAQLAGTVLARSPADGLELVRPAPGGPRLLWRAGPLAADGAVLAGRPVRIDAWATAPMTVVVRIDPAAGATTGGLQLQRGAASRFVPAGTTLSFRLCVEHVSATLSATRPVTLPDGRSVGATLASVKLVPGAACPPPLSTVPAPRSSGAGPATPTLRRPLQPLTHTR